VHTDSRIHLTMNHTVSSFLRASRVVRRSIPIAALALLPIATPVAAEGRLSPLPEASAPFGPMGWGLVVTLGLLAVAAGALAMGRPNRPKPLDRAANDSMLGTTIAEPAPAEARAAPEPESGPEAETRTQGPAATSPTCPEPHAQPDADTPRSATAAATSALTPDQTPSATGAREQGPRGDASSRAFLALHHVDLSIEALRRQLDRDARPMPAVWVMLLDLCRTHGREQRFRELALEFHHRFNVRAPGWDRYPPDRGEPGLEAYPRLVKAITASWGTHECRRLLDRLLYDNRGGVRRGFTLNAYNDLIALRRVAYSVLETIESDLALEARQRALTTPSAVATPGEVSANDEIASPSPLIQDLHDQLERDLAPAAAGASALEREHPAFTGVLVREWGNAALAGRLCEMLARGGDGARSLSAEAAEELELLRCMAERLGKTTGIAIAASG
jgi:hypothetical protein